MKCTRFESEGAFGGAIDARFKEARVSGSIEQLAPELSGMARAAIRERIVAKARECRENFVRRARALSLDEELEKEKRLEK